MRVTIEIETPGGDDVWEITGNVSGGSKATRDEPGSGPDVDIESVTLIVTGTHMQPRRTTLDVGTFLAVVGPQTVQLIDERLTEAAVSAAEDDGPDPDEAYDRWKDGD